MSVFSCAICCRPTPVDEAYFSEAGQICRKCNEEEALKDSETFRNDEEYNESRAIYFTTVYNDDGKQVTMYTNGFARIFFQQFPLLQQWIERLMSR